TFDQNGSSALPPMTKILAPSAMTLVALSAITAAVAITFMRSFIRVISFSSLLPSLRRIEKLLNYHADAWRARDGCTATHFSLGGPSGGRFFGVHSVALLAEARLHERITLFAAVVPGAEPFIERDQPVAAVVHLKIFVVEVVGIGVAIERRVMGELELVKTD